MDITYKLVNKEFSKTCNKRTKWSDIYKNSKMSDYGTNGAESALYLEIPAI